MKLITTEQRERMLANGRASAENPDTDHAPVVKLFTPDAGCTWLLSELDPTEPDIAFGLCDLGMGYPELGSVRILELEPYAASSACRSNATCISRPTNP